MHQKDPTTTRQQTEEELISTKHKNGMSRTFPNSSDVIVITTSATDTSGLAFTTVQSPPLPTKRPSHSNSINHLESKHKKKPPGNAAASDAVIG